MNHCILPSTSKDDEECAKQSLNVPVNTFSSSHISHNLQEHFTNQTRIRSNVEVLILELILTYNLIYVSSFQQEAHYGIFNYDLLFYFFFSM